MSAYPIIFVVAINRQNAIGRDGVLPWSAPKDLQTFQHITLHHPIIMGSKTWISIGKKPLKNRSNIILSKKMQQHDILSPALIASSVPDAIGKAEAAIATNTTNTGPAIMVIGGRQVFDAFQEHATEAYITIVDISVADADTFFPNFIQESWHVSDSVFRYQPESPAETHPKFSVYRYINPRCKKPYSNDRRKGLAFLHEDRLNSPN